MQPIAIEKLIYQAIDEIRKEKICLIEDIFKVYNCLSATKEDGVEYIINNPADKFDDLYELNLEQLQLELAIRSAQLKLRALQIMDYE